jgi:hypothetical protein
VQVAEIIRTDCTVSVLPAPDAEPEPEVPPVIEPVEPEPVVPLPLVVEPVAPDAVEPVDDEPLPIALPDALLSVPRISTWWPTCFWSSELSPPDRR